MAGEFKTFPAFLVEEYIIIDVLLLGMAHILISKFPYPGAKI